MLVLDGAILNTTEGVVQVLGDRTRFIAKVIALASIEVVDIADRTDNGSSSAGTSLLECIELVLRNLTALHLHTEVFSQLHQALVGDRWEDRCTLRCHIGIVLDTKEVGSTTPVHVLLLLGIEIEFACIALLVSNIVGSERSSIVATHLIYTCSERSRAVEITNDDIRVGRETTLEVRTYRSDGYRV